MTTRSEWPVRAGRDAHRQIWLTGPRRGRLPLVVCDKKRVDHSPTVSRERRREGQRIVMCLGGAQIVSRSNAEASEQAVHEA